MEEDQTVHHLKHLIEVLTTSGKDKLDEVTMKKVKKICKQSDSYVIELFRIISKQLRKKHAEIRFSAFQICDEIFRRSHCFRELLLKDFKQFANLVFGLDEKTPLPKPYAVAQKLKQKCVETFQQWYDEFGEGYLTLKLGYKFLRDCRKVDFAELTARSEAQRQRDEEERQRVENVKKKRIERIKSELEANTPEIKSTLLQLENAFKLLIPDVNNFFIPLENVSQDSFPEELNRMQKEMEEADGENEYGSEDMRNHGILKGVNVMINLEDMKRVKKTSDNEIVIQNMLEQHFVLKTKLLPQVKRWEESMRPYSEGNGVLIKQILDLKNSVEKNVNLFESVKIESQIDSSHSAQSKEFVEFDSDDDDDFIEVPFDDPRVQRALASEAALLGFSAPSKSESHHKDLGNDPQNQPSTSQAYGRYSLPKIAKPEGSKKKHPIEKCPDAFLSKMDQKPLRHQNPLAGLSQVWTAAPDLHEQEEVEATGGILGVATQRVHYESSWEPVKWECRAPLPTGRLCPRKDREKCPLHGPIVPRDESGCAILAEDAARDRAAREQYERDHPAWQDPHLLAEIKAATGVDLKIPKERAKRKRKYENLTDVRKTTPYDRLAKKVLSRRSVRRVNRAFWSEHSSNAWGSTNFNPS